ncbi:MAG: 3-phosphoshikimate 1-carboxyvinyltransferase [Candidatus Omnitrophica bacterium]|nr:3-phosphoshikimate 1-carboxyvinyltransferase [Candidatus Omnitrophota bacterium]
MIPFPIKHSGCLKGKLELSGDKSITHRAIIFGSLAKGKTRINNPAVNKDCFYTIQALRKLGIRITGFRTSTKSIMLFGKGLYGLKKPKGPIFVGDSGTTFRLMAGLLAGQKFNSVLTCAKSLLRRPMKRVIQPLRLMGAKISGKKKNGEFYPPVRIRPGNLKGVTYKMPVASAQVKSAIILAGLFAKNKTKIIEILKTRDHTERMLKLFRADLSVRGRNIIIRPGKDLVSPRVINVPADISSAAFFIVACLLLEGSNLKIKSVSLNPGRIGLIKALKRMGAKIEIQNSKSPYLSQAGRIRNYEPRGDLIVKYSKLKGITIGKDQIPSLIDELPILMVAASLAEGKTRLIGVEELRVKETDRVNSLITNLKRMGAKINVKIINRRQSIVIEGVRSLRGAGLKSFGDHRTAMSLIVAGLTAKGKSSIDDVSCLKKSFPDFIPKLKQLLKPVKDAN